MSIVKTRINVSVSKDVRRAVARLALRDSVPEATKAAELIRHGLQFEEDEIWDAIATVRDTPNAKFFSHKRAWA